VSSLVRRTLTASRALASRREAAQAPRVLTFDADTAVILAVHSTRGMLDACLRGQTGASRVEVEADPVAVPTPPAPEPEAETCPRWRASQVRRAYLSTLPPPADAPAPGHSCKRRA
jgi:hypothetical protein